jgi:hypothetical protein
MATAWQPDAAATGVAEELTAAEEFCDKNDTGAIPRRAAAI